MSNETNAGKSTCFIDMPIDKKADPKYDPESDYSGPLSIGAAVIRGNANADNTAPDISKMIVLSTSDFLDPNRLGNEQLDFVKNSTYWLLGRDELMGIGPRGIQRRKLNLIKKEVNIPFYSLDIYIVHSRVFKLSGHCKNTTFYWYRVEFDPFAISTLLKIGIAIY